MNKKLLLFTCLLFLLLSFTSSEATENSVRSTITSIDCKGGCSNGGVSSGTTTFSTTYTPQSGREWIMGLLVIDSGGTITITESGGSYGSVQLRGGSSACGVGPCINPGTVGNLHILTDTDQVITPGSNCNVPAFPACRIMLFGSTAPDNNVLTVTTTGTNAVLLACGTNSPTGCVNANAPCPIADNTCNPIQVSSGTDGVASLTTSTSCTGTSLLCNVGRFWITTPPTAFVSLPPTQRCSNGGGVSTNLHLTANMPYDLAWGASAQVVNNSAMELRDQTNNILIDQDYTNTTTSVPTFVGSVNVVWFENLTTIPSGTQAWWSIIRFTPKFTNDYNIRPNGFFLYNFTSTNLETLVGNFTPSILATCNNINATVGAVFQAPPAVPGVPNLTGIVDSNPFFGDLSWNLVPNASSYRLMQCETTFVYCVNYTTTLLTFQAPLSTSNRTFQVFGVSGIGNEGNGSNIVTLRSPPVNFFGDNGLLYGGNKANMASSLSVTSLALDALYSLLFILIGAATGYAAFETRNGALIGGFAGFLGGLAAGMIPLWIILFSSVLLAAGIFLVMRIKRGGSQ